mmetsp:Transcript_112762/g.318767  ORF Transcript_112762/g.318767 Transcript_112762/m.318767 type:complete len:254 (+) Transcript_112762:1232-1993(+)
MSVAHQVPKERVVDALHQRRLQPCNTMPRARGLDVNALFAVKLDVRRHEDLHGHVLRATSGHRAAGLGVDHHMVGQHPWLAFWSTHRVQDFLAPAWQAVVGDGLLEELSVERPSREGPELLLQRAEKLRPRAPSGRLDQSSAVVRVADVAAEGAAKSRSSGFDCTHDGHHSELVKIVVGAGRQCGTARQPPIHVEHAKGLSNSLAALLHEAHGILCSCRNRLLEGLRPRAQRSDERFRKGHRPQPISTLCRDY